MFDFEYSVGVSAIDRTLAPLRQIGQSIDRLKKKITSTFAGSPAMENFQKSLGKVQRNLAGAGRRFAATAAISAQVGMATANVAQLRDATFGLLQAPIRVGMEYQSAMAGVRAVTKDATKGVHATAEEAKKNFAALQASARELGATTTFSATQAAQGMDFLARSGMKTNEVIGAMPGMLHLAKAGNVELAQAADIASNMLGAFKLKADRDMGHVADVIVETFTSSNTSVEMLGDTMKYVAPVAQAVGVSLEETAAMAGLLGNVGIQSSQAGTVLRSALNRLAGPPKMAAAALEELGVSATDSTGKMLPITDTLGAIAEKLEGYGSGDRMALIKKIFGAEAAAGMSEVLAQGKGEIDRFALRLKGAEGAAERVSNMMSDNLQGNVQGLNSALEELGLVVYEAIVPALSSLAKWATGVVRAIGEWAGENPRLTKTILLIVGAIGGLAAVLVPIFSMVSMAVGAWGTFAAGIAAVKAAFLIAIPAVKLFGVALMTTPVGWIIAAIAALIAIIVALFVYREEIAAFFSGAWQGAKDFFGGLLDSADESLAGIGEWVSGVGDYFSSLLDIPRAVVSGLFALARAIPAGLIAAWENIKTAWAEAPEWFKGLVALLLLPFLPFIWTVKLIIAGWRLLQTFFGELLGAITAKIVEFTNGARQLWFDFLGSVQGLVAQAVRAIAEAWNWIAYGIQSAFNRALSYAVAALQALKTRVIGLITDVANSAAVRMIAAFAASVAAGAVQMVAAVDRVISSIYNKLSSLSSLAWNAGAKVIQTLARAIVSQAGVAARAVKTVLEKVRKLLPFSDAKEGPLSDLTYSGGALVTAFSTGVEKQTGRLVGAVRGAALQARGQLTPQGGDQSMARPAPLLSRQVSETRSSQQVVVDFRNMPRGAAVSQAGSGEIDLSLGYAMEAG